ncbi:putative permease [Desulfatibacillum alkenivorans DSM 16219]|jgi:putative permease|uniref:Putative permease n=1 Tax=Desulfatibacillum alkenivorans DSM 16219 TaxID=1121393 RepID=A0A1M6MFM3_9BACT|nr:AI-2E family transporter [Desulfatibacillum alkenivorans]SHJ82265.1 putative permease [Desulfatibacillum alkenivorans DSM 16219]
MISMIKNWVDRYLSDPQMVVLVLMLVTGLLSILYLGEMLMPVFVSIVIAYLLDGLVVRLQQFKIPRLACVIIVFVLFLSAMVILVVWLLPQISKQIIQLLRQLPDMLSTGQKQLMHLPEKYPEIISKAQVDQIFEMSNSAAAAFAKRAVSLSVASVYTLVTLVVYLVLVPFLVFFFLKDKEIIIGWMLRFRPSDMGLTRSVWHDVNRQVSNYVRGKGWEILIIWGLSFAVFKFLDLNYTLLLSLFTGLSVIFPYIGVTVMFFPVGLIAFFQWGVEPKALWAVASYGFIQIFDGQILAPLLLSEVVNLHPVAIIIAVLFFGGIWGVWGLFFAIPLATLVNVLLRIWLDKYEGSGRTGDSPAGSENP